MCLVEVTEIETYKILRDTTQSTNFVVHTVTLKTFNEDVEYTDSTRILCDSDLTKHKVHQIQEILMEYNFLPEGKLENKMTEDIKLALEEFQIEHKLPRGNVNLATLGYMGIKTY